ncbi:MAG: 2-amino-4-hydroxy-6-hydroxymethyldihydropteridine diphosphokinase [Chitinophagaceae bacterium]
MEAAANAYILLGTNLGDKIAYLNKAQQQLADKCGKIIQSSQIYETAAWGYTNQPSFYNQVILLETPLLAVELMNQMLQIEAELGRIRTEKMGPRTIDLDLLFYNNEVIDLPNLIVPHPRIAERRFVLIPMEELAPNWHHPVINKTIQQILAECPDDLSVQKVAQ